MEALDGQTESSRQGVDCERRIIFGACIWALYFDRISNHFLFDLAHPNSRAESVIAIGSFRNEIAEQIRVSRPLELLI